MCITNSYRQLGWTCDDHIISASNAYRAVKIHMRQYRIRNKQRSDNESSSYDETSEQWGKIRVTDEKGYKYYFN